MARLQTTDWDRNEIQRLFLVSSPLLRYTYHSKRSSTCMPIGNLFQFSIGTYEAVFCRFFGPFRCSSRLLLSALYNRTSVHPSFSHKCSILQDFPCPRPSCKDSLFYTRRQGKTKYTKRPRKNSDVNEILGLLSYFSQFYVKRV